MSVPESRGSDEEVLLLCSYTGATSQRLREEEQAPLHMPGREAGALQLPAPQPAVRASAAGMRLPWGGWSAGAEGACSPRFRLWQLLPPPAETTVRAEVARPAAVAQQRVGWRSTVPHPPTLQALGVASL